MQKIRDARQNNDTLALARNWYKLAKLYDTAGESVKSNSALIRALLYARSINNRKAVSTISNYLASNYSYTGQPDSAIYYYTVALSAGFQISDSLRIPPILINLGDEYVSTGNYVKAAIYSLSAIRIKELIKDSTDMAYYFQKLGQVYKVAGENEKWEEYIQKAYKLRNNEKYAPVSAVAAIYNDLGGIAESHKNYKQALLYYDTLITIGEKNSYDKAIAVALSNRATVLKNLGRTDEALNSALKAQGMRREDGYQSIYDNNLLAELFYAKNNLNKAKKYTITVINNKQLDNYPDEKIRAYKNMYQIEKANKNYKNALLWSERYNILTDSLRDKEVRTRIVDMELSYEIKKKENRINLLTTENKLKNTRIKVYLMLVAALFIIILLIVYILLFRKKQAELKQNILQQQILRAQMNPHFIFNVLGSIQNYLLQNDSRSASAFLSKFAALTRSVLDNSSTETITLAEEIKMLTNYIELEKMRSKNSFDYKIIYDDDLEMDFIRIPPMMLQPFIENAIKHGFAELDRHGMLLITITDKTDWVEFTVEDNGNGIVKKERKSGEHKSMAMKIFEKRRKLIQQKYKRDFKFELINLADTDRALSGVRVIINIPVIEDD